eukprot:gene46760-57391_t
MLHAGYLDQPYCDVMRSGRWVCTVTYGAGGEGGGGEHVVAIHSDDAGANWSAPNISTDGPGGKHTSRVDMLGTFNMRYSDDG